MVRVGDRIHYHYFSRHAQDEEHRDPELMHQVERVIRVNDDGTVDTEFDGPLGREERHGLRQSDDPEPGHWCGAEKGR